MQFLVLIVKSAFRNRLRTLLTATGVAIAIIAFLVLRTLVFAWYAGVESSSADRMIVRNKTSITFDMPISYVDKVRNTPGVTAVGYQNWFGGSYDKKPKEFFAKMATSDDVWGLYPEAVIDPAQLKAYNEDAQGAVVGAKLAEENDWHLGDRVVINGDIYPGSWTFNIRGIYSSTSRTFDVSTMFFHWAYLNNAQPDDQKDKVGIILMKVADANRSADVGASIDKLFANSPAETRTESEKAFQLEFVSMSGMLLSAIEVISWVVLAILMLILANTLAMATRERTTEYAVMRAIGFRPSHVVRLVIGEGFVIALLGVVLGVALATPVLKFVGSQMGAFLVGFDLHFQVVAVAVVVALVGGMLSSALPAWRAGRLNIVDALRRVE